MEEITILKIKNKKKAKFKKHLKTYLFIKSVNIKTFTLTQFHNSLICCYVEDKMYAFFFSAFSMYLITVFYLV